MRHPNFTQSNKFLTQYAIVYMKKEPNSKRFCVYVVVFGCAAAENRGCGGTKTTKVFRRFSEAVLLAEALCQSRAVMAFQIRDPQPTFFKNMPQFLHNDLRGNYFALFSLFRCFPSAHFHFFSLRPRACFPLRILMHRVCHYACCTMYIFAVAHFILSFEC